MAIACPQRRTGSLIRSPGFRSFLVDHRIWVDKPVIVTGAVKFSQECFYVKGGMHSWDFSSTVKASLGSSKDALGSGTDPFFGIGLGSEQMEFGYEYYKIEDGDISALTLRYAIQF